MLLRIADDVGPASASRLTLLEQLVAELTASGSKIGTVKTMIEIESIESMPAPSS